MNLIDDRRQFFASQVGVGEPWASARGNSMAYSFCQHVAASGKPLIITDAPMNPLVADNPAIPEMGVGAYAGMPLTNADGETLGTFCAVDTRPREWSAVEIEVLEVLADAAMREMELRAAVVELDRLNRFKSQIVGFAGHELRSPLSGIIGALEIIDMDLPAGHDREMVTLAMESGRRLLRMVNELLDVDALDRGTIPIQLTVQDLDPLVRTACEGARPMAASQGIVIEAAPSGLRVRADADRIVQVLANLIGNALKFSPKGSRVSLDAERVGPSVRVSVRDRGRGVPEAHKESIFEQFVQVWDPLESTCRHASLSIL